MPTTTQTIEFEHYVDEVLTPVDSVVLSNDPDAPTFGVRKVSDSSLVVASGVALVADSGAPGRYTYDVTGLTPGELYQYGLVWVLGSETDSQLKTFTAPPATSGIAEGLYADQNDVVDLIGVENLAIMSDVENDDAADVIDVPRVQRGFNSCDAWIHRELRRARCFRTPLELLDDDAVETIKEASARRVAWWCDQNRGTRDADPEKTPKGVAGILENHGKIAQQILDDIVFQPGTLNAAKLLASSTRPRLMSSHRVRSRAQYRVYVAAGVCLPPLFS